MFLFVLKTTIEFCILFIIDTVELSVSAAFDTFTGVFSTISKAVKSSYLKTENSLFEAFFNEWTKAKHVEYFFI